MIRMDVRKVIERIKFFKKRIGDRINGYFFKVKRFYLRVRGKDPDLVTKVTQLYSQRERYKAIIRKHHEKMRDLREEVKEKDRLGILVKELESKNAELENQAKELIQQIGEMENDFCEFKRYYLAYLKGSSDWKSRAEALSEFLSFLEATIPLTQEEQKSIPEAHETARKMKTQKKTGETNIRKLFTKLGLIKKDKTPLLDTELNR